MDREMKGEMDGQSRSEKKWTGKIIGSEKAGLY